MFVGPRSTSFRRKLKGAILLIDPNGLPFPHLPFQNGHAQGVENLFLDRSFQRPRTVDGVEAFPGDKRFGSIGETQSVLLQLEPMGKLTSLKLHDLL